LITKFRITVVRLLFIILIKTGLVVGGLGGLGGLGCLGVGKMIGITT
jgi:hypothetical protein